MSIMPLTSVVKEAQFNEVLQANPKVVAIFYASWCCACKTILPVYTDLSEQYKDIKFVTVDIDEALELSYNYRIASMPTCIFFDNGMIVNKAIGSNKPLLVSKTRMFMSGQNDYDQDVDGTGISACMAEVSTVSAAPAVTAKH